MTTLTSTQSPELCNMTRNETHVEDLTVSFNTQRGFYFRTSTPPAELPNVFERAERCVRVKAREVGPRAVSHTPFSHRKRNVTTCTSAVLRQLNARVAESVQEIFGFTSG